MDIRTIPTNPCEGQKPGTSGLRKKVAVVRQPNYLENFVQSIFDALPAQEVRGCTLFVSGDGRYYNRQAIQIIAEIAAANGVRRLWIGQGGLVSTPAASAIIREREGGVCYGGILLTASHNPGGPENDFGIKYNTSNGGPALEALTDAIYKKSLAIKEYKKAVLPTIDLDTVGVQELIPETFTVEIIDPVEDWMRLMRNVFDFELIRKLLSRVDFHMVYDGLSGVAGPYAKALFMTEFHLPAKCLRNCDPKEDFGGGHPDPNLTYAKELVSIMKPLAPPAEVPPTTPDFGAAGDGDNDRNMILGKGFFVTPSDSVAVIAAYAERCIPYFKSGLKGVSRSMPTSCALDNVAKARGLRLFETPTGWKFFGNLMDAGMLSICGEESFGTGSDHIREKDGLWAVLCWLSILAYRNQDESAPLVSVQNILEEFWSEYGRNYYSRYDYEEVDSTKAARLMEELESLGKDLGAVASKRPAIAHLLQGDYVLAKVDNFTYVDPVDKSVSRNQGVRYIFQDGSRIVWRLSGTGSVGATVRMYLEKYDRTDIDKTAADSLRTLTEIALGLCQMREICGRDAPTVIT